MNVYLNEDEQLEGLKSFLRRYSGSIIVGVVLALALSFGWRFWINYQAKIHGQASMVYEEMLNNVAGQQDQIAKLQAQQIIADYTKTPYASLSAFVLAKLAVDQKDYNTALKQLNWVKDHTKSDDLKELATIRIARILIAENQPQKALDLLNQTKQLSSYEGMIAQVSGDADLALNNKIAAKKAYQKALQKMPSNNPYYAIINMKLANV